MSPMVQRTTSSETATSAHISQPLAAAKLIVGPRPSLPYEAEHFEPHHFERFLVPPGVTGLWQVTARAQSTWAEALDMDVAYVRGWSLGLDLWLLLKTPAQIFRLKTC